MGFVYVLQSGDKHNFKIGRTRNEAVETRRKTLATGNPDTLSVFDAIETEYFNLCETYLHRILQSKRISGDSREFFQIEPNELRTVIEIARAYVAELAELNPIVEELESAQCDTETKSPGNEDWSLYHEIITLREAESKIQFQRELLETKLKISIGLHAGIAGIATWTNVERSTFDVNSFKKEYPELFEGFRKLSSSRRFVLR